MLDMSWQRQLSSLDQRQLVVDVRSPTEWIVGVPALGHALHVFRLAPGDWLVSEVGRDSEGRGADLKQALAALSARVSPAGWWDVVAEALDASEKLVDSALPAWVSVCAVPGPGASSAVNRALR